MELAVVVVSLSVVLVCTTACRGFPVVLVVVVVGVALLASSCWIRMIFSMRLRFAPPSESEPGEATPLVAPKITA